MNWINDYTFELVVAGSIMAVCIFIIGVMLYMALNTRNGKNGSVRPWEFERNIDGTFTILRMQLLDFANMKDELTPAEIKEMVRDLVNSDRNPVILYGTTPIGRVENIHLQRRKIYGDFTGIPAAYFDSFVMGRKNYLVEIMGSKIVCVIFTDQNEFPNAKKP